MTEVIRVVVEAYGVDEVVAGGGPSVIQMVSQMVR